MSRPTIIMAAPNGARKVKTDHPELPVSIAETIAAAKACHAEGASILHAHVRGDQDEHVLDVARYQTLLAGLREQVPDMLVQVTTEAVGVYSPQQQIDVVFGVKPDFVSVGLREMLGDDSAAARQLAKDFYHRATAEQIHIQHILYDASDITCMRATMAAGILPARPPHVLLVLGRYAADFQSDPSELAPLIADGLPDMASWSVCAFGHKEYEVMTTAVAAGGHCRVGFENNMYLKDGSLAPDNAALIRQLATSVRPANRDETLAIFNN
jgi:3-keto-5-aminohexanoate cleavage enzyme